MNFQTISIALKNKLIATSQHKIFFKSKFISSSLTKKIPCLSIIVPIFCLSACANTNQVHKQTLNGNYQLIQSNEYEFSPNEINENFFKLEKNNRGFAYLGCNRIFFQNKTSEKNKIKFESIGSTRMACPEHHPEDAFLRSLEKINNYKNMGEYLILLHDQKQLIKLKATQ